VRDSSTRVRVALAAVVGVAAYLFVDLAAGVALGAVAFYVFSLITSGYRPARALAWGGFVAALFIANIVAPEPLAGVCLVGAVLVFLAPVLSRDFRRAWIGKAQE
jgi:hypothetical protein